MKKLMSWLIAMFVFPTFLSSQSAVEISRKSMDATDSGNLEMSLTINIRDGKGNDRMRKIDMVSRGFAGVNKTKIRFTAPADVAGTALLIYDYDNKDDDMWIYMPALRKVRRIVSTERGKSFMGSEFTNADMSKPNQSDFNYTLTGQSEVNGISCFVLEAACKDRAIQAACGFAKQISYIDKESFLCYKVEFYNSAGKLHRVQTISGYKKLSPGKYLAQNMKMENVLNGRISEMTISKSSPAAHLKESEFTPGVLGE